MSSLSVTQAKLERNRNRGKAWVMADRTNQRLGKALGEGARKRNAITNPEVPQCCPMFKM